MYMNLKPNKHKISFNTTIMVSLGFIAPLAPLNLVPSPNLIICSGPPPKKNYFCLKFLGHPLKIGQGCYHAICVLQLLFNQIVTS